MFQPVILAGMVALSLTAAGAIDTDTLKLYVLGLPALLAGLRLAFKCYGKLDDAMFRKLVLMLLLCAGLALIAAQGWPLLRPMIAQLWRGGLEIRGRFYGPSLGKCDESL